MDITDVLKVVLDAMVTAEKISELDGESKRNAVIDYLKLNFAQYDRYTALIPVIIELIIIVSRTKVAINVKKSCKLFCS
jgi:hypothetical protein